MRKLQALVRHILTETGISSENVAAFLDQGAVVLTGRNLGHGVEVCVLKYDGVIDIERSDYDGIALLALVSGWRVSASGAALACRPSACTRSAPLQAARARPSCSRRLVPAESGE